MFWATVKLLLMTSVTASKNLSTIYCEGEADINEEKVFKEIIEKLKCLMSNRAVVMKSFDSKMAAFKNELLGKESSTYFIFCNAHFVLGLSTAASVAAKVVEDEFKTTGSKLGRDASSSFNAFSNSVETASNRIIRLTSEVLGPRGDEKSGCRQEWLAFLSSQGKKSTFSSFRSNRFNNLFQSATALLHHKDDIIKFLNEYVSSSNLKLENILLDLKDSRILSFIFALSFFHELFTEPYWKLLNSTEPYSRFPKYVQLMESTLQSWISPDFDLFSAVPVFSNFGATCALVFSRLKAAECKQEHIILSIKKIAEQFWIVLKRQLSDFQEGGVFWRRKFKTSWILVL
ncbi:hypothetical protein PoB_005114400 [Plakobranchus ocellatus]|uniref:Uncharacterized protein n=1 Tax=Plakobranchus ocellatus TaxID=259542 RepID=A0AAV4C0I2_9GAST|nr:hypothetical protein PoB_005114400 [Plakobranchus ocellatus]